MDKLLYGLLLTSSSPLFLFGCKIVVCAGMNTSGWLLTCWVNQFVLNLVISLTYRIMVNGSVGIDELSFNDHVKRFCLGDDWVMSMSREAQEKIDLGVLTDLIKRIFGITITGSLKGSIPIWKKDVTELQFISRGVRKESYGIVAPLKLDSFMKMLHWLAPSKEATESEVLMSIRDSSKREALFHGEEFYYNFQKLYQPRFEYLNIFWGETDYSKLLLEYIRGRTGCCLPGHFGSTILGTDVIKDDGCREL